MTVFVTGGAGYIGSHTCVELLEQGMEVVVADNLVNSSAKALKRVEQITGKTLTYYQADIRDQAALDRIFEAHSVDCVMHFAGPEGRGRVCGKASGVLHQQPDLHAHPLQIYGGPWREKDHFFFLRHRLLRR